MKEMGYDVVFMESEKGPVPAGAKSVEAIVCNDLFSYHSLDEFPDLKYVQVTSAGLDRVPVREINYRLIVLKNARGVYSIPIAEWVVLKVLEIVKDSKHFYEAQTEHKWLKSRNLTELPGQKAVIIGFGHIGKEIAKRLQAFGVKIVAINTKSREHPEADDCFGICDLCEILPDCDIVISTLPLKEETRHLISEKEFGLMKDGSIFVNVSRGAVVDEQALINAVANHKFRGVALDVFEEEPLKPEHPFWSLENVIITPHNCYVSDKIKERMICIIMKNLENYQK
jgi:phosphoglycerate dehydrogenase-like enzyme